MAAAWGHVKNYCLTLWCENTVVSAASPGPPEVVVPLGHFLSSNSRLIRHPFHSEPQSQVRKRSFVEVTMLGSSGAGYQPGLWTPWCCFHLIALPFHTEALPRSEQTALGNGRF